MRKTIERAYTRVLARSKNWSGRLWYREVIGKLIVSVEQMQAQPWRSHNIWCPFNKTDLIEENLWYNLF